MLPEGVAALVSIHAPTRGATRNQPKKEKKAISFNPRAHAGRDKKLS
uniref:Uncharacterized protein n=1 Tax=uncultured bacterium contig00101 TaxID=1181568 RepID=A0A806KCZ3_9BACT|nr:hypothetical protein [uncultured bacterium contig00101]